MTRVRIRAALLTLFAVFALVVAVSTAPQAQTKPELALKSAMDKELVDRDPKAAIDLYRKLVTSPDRGVAAQAWLHIAQCYEKLGAAQDDEARKAYEQLVRGFADQKNLVAQAQIRLAALGGASSGPASGRVERQVWSLPEGAVLGSLSADGRSLSFLQWQGDSSARIVVHDLISGDDRTVSTNALLQTGYAVLSPDGKQIAGLWRGADGAGELRILQTDSASLRTLLSSKEYLKPDGWSPDGKYILVRISREGRPWDMARVSVADGSVEILKSGGGIGAPRSDPRFSPDGRYIVHAADRVGLNGEVIPATDYRATLHVMSADGSGEVPLVRGAPTEKDWDPVWTPDGRTVVFRSDRSGTVALWAMRVIDGKPQGEPDLLRSEAADLSLLGFARDGTLYTGRDGSLTDVYVADIDVETGKVLAGPRRVNQAYVGRSVGPLAWSPDGKTLAFNRADISKKTLVVHSMDTGQERELTQSPPSVVGWFRDGQSLLVGYRQLSRVDLRTGQARLVAELKRDPPGFGTVALSPDGKTVFYWTSDGISAQRDNTLFSIRVIRHSLENNQEEEIYQTQVSVNSLGTIAVSPDGSRLAFTEYGIDGNTIKILPAEGGEARKLFDRSAIGFTFSRDGRYLLARGIWTDGTVKLLVIPVDGGPVRPIGLETGWSGLAVHPDGRQIAFAVGIDATDIVAIKNLLVDPKAAR